MSDKKQTIHCPLKLAGATANPLSDYAPPTECDRHECAWWTRLYSTEEILQEGMCAIKAIAEKNSDGMLPV